jgi:hypothetical protein
MRIDNLRMKIAAALLVAGAPLSAFAADGGTWDWVIAPYLWAPAIGTSVHVDVPPVDTGGTTQFSDVVSKLNFALPLHVEGQGDDFGIFADVLYLSLSQERHRELFTTATDQKFGIFELAGVWSPGEQRHEGFEAFGGLRYLWANIDLKIKPVNTALPSASVGVDKSFSDFMVGGRYRTQLSDNWALSLRGDGSWGGTDGIYTASFTFEYGGWLLGYKYQQQKYGFEDRAVKVNLYGPVVGYAFKF